MNSRYAEPRTNLDCSEYAPPPPEHQVRNEYKLAPYTGLNFLLGYKTKKEHFIHVTDLIRIHEASGRQARVNAAFYRLSVWLTADEACDLVDQLGEFSISITYEKK